MEVKIGTHAMAYARLYKHTRISKAKKHAVYLSKMVRMRYRSEVYEQIEDLLYTPGLGD